MDKDKQGEHMSRSSLMRTLYIQGFSLVGDDSKWCNVVAWMTALGLESLLVAWTDPCRLRLEFLSTLPGIKRRNGLGRYRISRVEVTSSTTPRRMQTLKQDVMSKWTTIFSEGILTQNSTYNTVFVVVINLLVKHRTWEVIAVLKWFLVFGFSTSWISLNQQYRDFCFGGWKYEAIIN